MLIIILEHAVSEIMLHPLREQEGLSLTGGNRETNAVYFDRYSLCSFEGLKVPLVFLPVGCACNEIIVMYL